VIGQLVENVVHTFDHDEVCVAVCYSVVCCSVMQRGVLQCVVLCCCMLQCEVCVAVCCSVGCFTVLQCVSLCCTVLHFVALIGHPVENVVNTIYRNEACCSVIGLFWSILIYVPCLFGFI